MRNQLSMASAPPGRSLDDGPPDKELQEKYLQEIVNRVVDRLEAKLTGGIGLVQRDPGGGGSSGSFGSFDSLGLLGSFGLVGGGC